MTQDDAISASKHSNAEQKLSRTRGLKPFGKGHDPRRNLKGRPRTFDEARALAQRISHEIHSGNLTVAENVLRKLAFSKEPQALKIFLEYAFGPVPAKSEMLIEHKTKLFLNYAHEDRHPRADRSSLPPAISSGAN